MERFQKDVPGFEASRCFLDRFPLMKTPDEAMAEIPPLVPINNEQRGREDSSGKTQGKSHDWAKFSIASILSSSNVKKESFDEAVSIKPPAPIDAHKPDDLKNGEICENGKDLDKILPSYTSMIGQAILQSRERKLTLGEIYDFIEQQFPGIEDRVKGWRNCVRHNLSLHECFLKLGPSAHGRGSDWTVHPTYLERFLRGHFRKRIVSKRRSHSLLNIRPWPPIQTSNGLSVDMGKYGTNANQQFKISPPHGQLEAEYDNLRKPNNDFSQGFISRLRPEHSNTDSLLNSPSSRGAMNGKLDYHSYHLERNDIQKQGCYQITPINSPRDVISFPDTTAGQPSFIQNRPGKIRPAKETGEQDLGDIMRFNQHAMHSLRPRFNKGFKAEVSIAFSQKHRPAPRRGSDIHPPSCINGPRPKCLLPSIFPGESPNIFRIPTNMGRLCHVEQSMPPTRSYVRSNLTVKDS